MKGEGRGREGEKDEGVYLTSVWKGRKQEKNVLYQIILPKLL